MNEITSVCRPALGNGVRGWLVQRVTALISAVYLLFLLGFLLSHPHLDYETWFALFHAISMQVFSVLFWLALSWHAWIGMWTVVTDYVKLPALRLIALGLILLTLVLMAAWVLLTLVKL